MATISANTLARLRRQYAAHVASAHAKAVLNTVFQAIEDYMSDAMATRPATSLNSAINAVGGNVLSSEQKRIAFACWADARAEMEGVA